MLFSKADPVLSVPGVLDVRIMQKSLGAEVLLS